MHRTKTTLPYIFWWVVVVYLVKPALQDGGAAVLVVEEGAVERVGQDDAHAAGLAALRAGPEEGVRPRPVVLEALYPE